MHWPKCVRNITKPATQCSKDPNLAPTLKIAQTVKSHETLYEVLSSHQTARAIFPPLIPCTFLCLPLPDLSLICMLRGVKYIDGKFQEYRPLDNRR
jgi:hypothetical protein